MDPTKKELYTAKRSSGLDTSSDGEVAPAVEQLRSDADPINWVALTVQNNIVRLTGKGGGGLAELCSTINDDDIFFAAFRCQVGGQVKFYHLFFVGQNVGGMKKGKASLHKSGVFQLIDAHGEISCVNGMDELSVDFLRAEVQKLSGSSDIDS